MTRVAVITVLRWRLDVALALAAKLPRLALDGLLTFFGCHVFLAFKIASVISKMLLSDFKIASRSSSVSPCHSRLG